MECCIFCQGTSFSEKADFFGSTQRYQGEKFSYGKCAGCGSLQKLSKGEPDYTGYVTGDSVSARKVQRIVHLLRENGIGATDLVLDYGCAQGALVRELRARGFVAEGYEPFSAEFNSIPVGKRYASVLLTHVFEHLPDYGKFFAHLKKITSLGSIIITIHPSSSRFSRLDPENPFQQWAVHAPFHGALPSDIATKKLFQESGFRLVKFFPYDVQRSGFWDNSRVSALLFQALGRTKEGVLRASRKDKRKVAFQHSFSFVSALFFRTKDELASTFVWERMR